MDCEECTLCCKLLEIQSTESPIETYCKYCEPYVGCKIYEKKPEECSQYKCMWSQMEYAGIELRPDKCHVIFDRVGDDVISARIEKRHKLNGLVLGQLNAFNNDGFSVLLLNGNLSSCFLAKGHTQDYVKERVIDCAKLHGRSN
jgi:hypothetical protein